MPPAKKKPAKRPRKPKAEPNSVTEALEAELKRFPANLANSTLAATARRLAQALDSDNSATSKSMCARSLAEIMDTLYERAPEDRKADGVDDLERKRAARRRSTA